MIISRIGQTTGYLTLNHGVPLLDQVFFPFWVPPRQVGIRVDRRHLRCRGCLVSRLVRHLSRIIIAYPDFFVRR